MSCGTGGCCPPAQILKEELCGNFTEGTEDVWTAPPGAYFGGTFQIFNSAASQDDVTGTVTHNATTTDITAPPGFTISESFDENPTLFTITAPAGTSGSYCITLYRRVLA